jgi:hypothetical protein
MVTTAILKRHSNLFVHCFSRDAMNNMGKELIQGGERVWGFLEGHPVIAFRHGLEPLLEHGP